ncbi:cytochrome P450 4A10-like [Mytilus californianus]|uniref:cytochrome P450 4A10-like n=1 Tax=Mytilus californianus TaxID=6549 RepID=UPI002247462C|nr:cytochrome P450 4A10-like [Mytilus californianus]
MVFSTNISIALLVIVITYLLWRIRAFIIRYRQWRTATYGQSITILGPLHPIWGTLHLIHDLASYFKLLRKIVEKERPKVYVAWNMFFYPSFGVCHPDSAQILYKSSAPKAYAVGGAYRYLRDWIGDGLLISDGKKWERNRRLLTPGFHFEILKPYVKVYNSVTDVFLEKLKVNAKSGEAIDIFPRVAFASLDTILRCAFSYQGNIQDQGSKHPYVNAVNRLSYLTLSRCLKPWYQIDFIYRFSNERKELKQLCDYSHEFSNGIIKERKQTLKKEGQPTKRHLDFLDILLTAKDENGIGLSDEDIRAEVDTFMFEGHDTTASAISWSIYCLGKYPEEQEIVFTEISELLVDKPEVTWENLQEMPHLTAFVKESMRMFAPVPGTARLLTSPMKFGDIIVPAGVQIDISIHSIHHHPDVWPEHDVFRPERFLQDDITDRHPYSYIPFAAGSRNCIGQNFAMNEIKVIISRLVQRYKVSLVDGHNYDINPELVMRATNGIKVILENR